MQASLSNDFNVFKIHMMVILVNRARKFGVMVEHQNSLFVLRNPRLQCSFGLAIVYKIALTAIEGFGGKRALWFLLKSELCQKRFKFCIQFCLRVSNNVLHVFSLNFASFSRYYICKKPSISCDISMNSENRVTWNLHSPDRPQAPSPQTLKRRTHT